MAEQEGLETERGGLQSAEGVCTRPGESTQSFLVHLRDINHGEITRTGQAGPLHGVCAVRFAPIAWFFREQSGGHHPAGVVLFRSIAGEPGATGAGCGDEDERLGLGWHLAEEGSARTLAGADGAEEGDVGAVSVSDRSDRDRLLVDIHAEKEWARLRHG